MSNDDESKSSVGDNMENRTFNAPDAGIENEELERELEKALYRVLSKRDADIICNFYGIAGRRAMSVGELADIYNLTDTRINQIRRSAEEKMRNDDETVELLQYLTFGSSNHCFIISFFVIIPSFYGVSHLFKLITFIS